MPLVMIGLGARWWHVVVGFALFRLFDIWKPPPVSDAEDFSGGIGIVLDDLFAAAYACVATHLVVYLVSVARH
jgi:phosphatidylglycerophosphatase A